MVVLPILLPMLVGSPVHPNPRIVAPIHYQLDYARPGDAQVRVTVRLPTPLPRPAAFVMPRAIPMGYGTQPHDRFVSDLAAFDPAGRPIRLTDLDGPRWLVESGSNLPSHRATAVKVTVLSTMLAGDPAGGIGEWGYAALVEVDGYRILFDTGARPETVLRNAAGLGIDLSAVTDVILSHNHDDHTGGLLTLRREMAKKNPAALGTVHVARAVSAVGSTFTLGKGIGALALAG
ncbi:MAG: MBL fold metallo-hydrolase [Gemmatimonadales bacterium]